MAPILKTAIQTVFKLILSLFWKEGVKDEGIKVLKDQLREWKKRAERKVYM